MKRDLLESGKFSRKMRFIFLKVLVLRQPPSIFLSYLALKIYELFSMIFLPQLGFVENLRRFQWNFQDRNVLWFNFTSSISNVENLGKKKPKLIKYGTVWVIANLDVLRTVTNCLKREFAWGWRMKCTRFHPCCHIPSSRQRNLHRNFIDSICQPYESFKIDSQHHILKKYFDDVCKM